MISIILQAVTIAAILLGLTVVAGLVVAFHSKRRQISENHLGHRAGARTLLAHNQGIEAVVGMIDNYGIPKVVLQSYWEVKDALVSLLHLEERKDQTEREIMRRIMATPSVEPARGKLERIYQTYERVRFGVESISTNDFQLFFADLRQIFDNLRQQEREEEG